MKRNTILEDEIEESFRNASRRLLFRDEGAIPGEGRSAAEIPGRHFRQKVTINLDADIVSFFKDRAAEEKTPYQFLINQVLREFVHGTRPERLARSVGDLLLSDESFRQKLKEVLRDELE